MNEAPRVTVEEQLPHGKGWAVLVERPGGLDAPLVWGRYATQAEAELQAVEARAWLFANPSEDKLPGLDDDQHPPAMP